MNSNGPLDRLVERCRETGVRRAQDRRWVAGVCIGLAHRWNVDPVLIRVGFILLTIFGGIGITVYLLCWLLLPGADGSVALDRALRAGDGAAITLFIFTVVVTIGTLTPDDNGPPSGLLGLVLLGLVVWWLVHSGRFSAGAATPASTQSAHEAAGTTAPTATAPTPSTASTALAPTTSAPSGPAGTSPAATGSTTVTGSVPATGAASPSASAAPGVATGDVGQAPAGPRPGAATAHTPSPIQDVLPSQSAPHAGTRQEAAFVSPATSRSAGASGAPGAPGAPHDPAHVADRHRHDRSSGLVTLLTAGLALLAYLGADAAVAGLDLDRPWLVGLAAALGVIGISLVITAFTGHRVPMLRVAAWILGISLVTSTATAGVSGEDHDVTWRPTTASEVLPVYDHGVGSAQLDLTALPADGVRDISVSHGIGELTILVPANVTTRVEAEKGPGPLRVEEDGHSRELGDGFSTIEPFTLGSGPEAYRLEVDAGVGEVEIRVVRPTSAPAPASQPASKQEVTP